MGIVNSIITIVDFALGIYTWLILIRVLLSWVNPDPYNPIVQFLVRVTEPVLEPLRRMIPAIAGMDLSPIVALFAISLLQQFLASLVHSGMGSGAFLMLFVKILSLLHLLLTFYLILLLARGGLHIHSWYTFRRARSFRINLNNAVVRFIFQATEPVILPLRRWVPTFSGLDVSPLAAALGLILFLSLLQDITLKLGGS